MIKEWITSIKGPSLVILISGRSRISRGGYQSLRRVLTDYLTNLFLKTAWKWRNCGRGGVSLAPTGSSNTDFYDKSGSRNRTFHCAIYALCVCKSVVDPRNMKSMLLPRPTPTPIHCLIPMSTGVQESGTTCISFQKNFWLPISQWIL